MLRKLPLVAVATLIASVSPAPAQFQQQDEQDQSTTFFTRTLPEVLEDYYDAIGGEEAWDAVQTLKITGNMKMGPGIEAPFVMYQKRPRKLRLQFEVQGLTGIQAYDGAEGWMFMPFTGQTTVEAMPLQMVEQFREQADLEGPLVHHDEKGHQIEMVAEEMMAGKMAIKLQVTLATGQVRYYFLDKQEFLPLAMTGMVDREGVPTNFTVSFTEYEKVGDGLRIPHRIDSRVVGAAAGQTVTIETIEMDLELAESLFSRPTADQLLPAPEPAEDAAAADE